MRVVVDVESANQIEKLALKHDKFLAKFFIKIDMFCTKLSNRTNVTIAISRNT